jgi:hypothetical protein
MRRNLLPCAAAALLARVSAAARADPEVEALAIAAGVVVVAASLADTARGEAPDAIALEVGRFDAIKKVQPASAFGGEYRAGRLLWWELSPFAGAGFTSQHSVYGYGGVRIATSWSEHLVITPSFALGPRRGQGPGPSATPGPLRHRRRIPPRARLPGRFRLSALFQRQSPGPEREPGD